MIEKANANCPIITRENVRDEVERLGAVCKESVKLALKGKFFSLTTDHWTSKNNETYSCLTAHYIEDGVMKHAVLTFEVFKGSTNGERLGEDFQEKFDAYGFELRYIVAVRGTTRSYTLSQANSCPFRPPELHPSGCGASRPGF